MKLLDIINSPWGITSEHLQQIAMIYSGHLKGEKIDFKAIDKTNSLEREQHFQVINGKAIIPITGPLTQGASFFNSFFGGSSMENIKKNIQQAVSEGHDIILHIDSPGGTVAGAFELSAYIESVAKDHSVTAFSDGMIASAAVLIGSAANQIFITGKTNQVGSIGVISKRFDFSEQDKNAGIVVEEFVSGKYKNINSSDKKLTDFDREAIQAQVDYLYTLFADEVSRLRNIDVKTINNWEAKIFIGEQALTAKLVDGVSTLEELLDIENLNQIILDNKGNIMSKTTLESLESDSPELLTKIKKDSYDKGIQVGVESGKKEGIEFERKRIAGIEKVAAAFPGQDELRLQFINDPSIASDQAAIQFASVQKANLDQVAVNIQNELPKPIDVIENQTQEPEEKKDFNALVTEYSIENKCNRRTAIKAVAKLHPEEHRKSIGQ